jgi:uncharacterized protein YjdB
MVKAVGLGSANISATVDGKTGLKTLSVTVVPIASISFLPDTASVTVGQAAALSVIVKDSVGNTVTGRQLAWTSSDTTKAKISTAGIVAGLAAGTVDVTASAEGKSGSARIRILPIEANSTAASVSLSIPRAAFRVGEFLQAAAFPLDSAGGVLTSKPITWSSSNGEVATVSSGGLVTGVGPGIATISATVDGKTGNLSVQVSLVPVSTVTVNPTSEAVSSGGTVKMTVTLKDSAGKVLSGRTIAWNSSSPSVATVDSQGVVTGVLVGSTDIVATSEGKQGKALVTVNTLATPVATVTLDPADVVISGGATKQLIATLRDANGNALGGRAITWGSSNPDRATISQTGLVNAAAVDGPVVITATAEGKSATASIGIMTFIRMSVGHLGTCGMNAAGEVYCWSFNGAQSPTKISGNLKFVAISAGSYHSCGIVEGSDVYCWGSNSNGQLGDGTKGGSTTTPIKVIGGYKFVSVAPGRDNTCATTADREIYCWGYAQYTYDDIYGGGGGPRYYLQPTKVGIGMVAVVGGPDGSYCSVDGVGLGYCWTFSYYTGLGNGPTVGPIRGPVSTTLRFTTLRVGYGHACGIVESGQAYCWGRNDKGQLGDGSRVNHAAPAVVAGGIVFESLAAGGSVVLHEEIPADPYEYRGISCGITPLGKAYCWGANDAGQLGIGSNSEYVATPQAVAGNLSFTGLRGGASSVCGLASTGAAICWGGNTSNVPVPAFGR